MSQYEQLATYLLVVETGSFTAAGDRLGISANAVSKQVTQLEEQLGITLLERSTRRLMVTALGQTIYEKGKSVESGLAEISEYAHFAQKNPSGMLVVACPIGAGQSFIETHLGEFLEQHPQLTVKLLLVDKMPSFRNESGSFMDVAFGFSMLSVQESNLDKDIVRRKIYEVRRILCATPSYLKKNGEPSFSDLQNHCLIAHSIDERNQFLKECRKRNVAFPRILYVNNSATVLLCAKSSLGIANLADFLVKNELSSGKLQKLTLNYQEAPIPCYLFYKKIRYLPPKVACFIKFVDNKFN